MRELLAALLLLLAPLSAAAQVTPAPPQSAPQPSEALRARIAELLTVLKGEGDYETFFAPRFRADVPRVKVEEIAAQLRAAGGPITGVENLTPETSNRAALLIGYRDGVASMRISISPAPPHEVDMLLVTGFNRRETSLPEIISSFSKLSGKSGIAIATLGDGPPQLVTGVHQSVPFAIGSGFKLVILAELIRAIEAGERSWDDKVVLDGTILPAGFYALLLKGTEVPLREVALRMISVSDNSATDILLKLLGRDKVEAMLPVVGLADPRGMRPFLSTMEAFKLKGIRQGALAAEWLAKDEAGRRAMLDDRIAAETPLAIDRMLFRDGKPRMIDTIEWFATPLDMIRVMDWLRRHTEGPKGEEARRILSANHGIPPEIAGKYRFVGYKGGSETGVIHMTLLFEDGAGVWRGLSASWNDTAAEVDTPRFAGLVARAVDLAAQ